MRILIKLFFLSLFALLTQINAKTPDVHDWIAPFGNWSIISESDTNHLILNDCITIENKWNIYYILYGQRMARPVTLSADIKVEECSDDRSAGFILKKGDTLFFYLYIERMNGKKSLKLVQTNHKHEYASIIDNRAVETDGLHLNNLSKISLTFTREKATFKIGSKTVGALPNILNKGKRFHAGLCTDSGALVCSRFSVTLKGNRTRVMDFSKANLNLLNLHGLWKNKSETTIY
jgi:hypothetical protein